MLRFLKFYVRPCVDVVDGGGLEAFLHADNGRRHPRIRYLQWLRAAALWSPRRTGSYSFLSLQSLHATTHKNVAVHTTCQFCYRQESLWSGAQSPHWASRIDEQVFTGKYTVFQKSDAKIQITITTAHLIRINYPLSSFNYCLSGTNVANFNKIHLMVSKQ